MRGAFVRKNSFYKFEKKGFLSDSGMSSERGEPCGTRENRSTALKHPTFPRVRLPPEPAHHASSPCRGRPPFEYQKHLRPEIRGVSFNEIVEFFLIFLRRQDKIRKGGFLVALSILYRYAQVFWAHLPRWSH